MRRVDMDLTSLYVAVANLAMQELHQNQSSPFYQTKSIVTMLNEREWDE
jgi:hypothetical protein